MAVRECLALAVLLRDHGVDMKMVPDKEKEYPNDAAEDVKWPSNEILCYKGKAPETQDEKNRLSFLLFILDVQAIEPN